MFHTKFHPDASVRAITSGELALREFLAEQNAALRHAAALLSDRRGAQLVNVIRDGLSQPGPLTARLRRRLLELRGLLLLEHTDDWDNADIAALLEPEDAIVPEICLLADGLDDAMRSAGILPAADEQAA